jgi:hypothetical protein
MTEDSIILVPNGHQLAGSSITLYPSNGATTYTEGTLSFVSPQSQAVADLRAALADTRKSLDALRTPKLNDLP